MQETCSKIGRKELQYAEHTGESCGGWCTIPDDLKLFLHCSWLVPVQSWGGKRCHLPGSGKYLGAFPSAQTTTPEELKGRKTPEKSDGSKNQAWGPWGAGSDEGGEAREWASLAWLMQQVPGEHEEIIAIKWHGWDRARECCAVEMEMNAKYVKESSCVYCSAFRKAPGSLALRSVDVINRKTLCFWG